MASPWIATPEPPLRSLEPRRTRPRQAHAARASCPLCRRRMLTVAPAEEEDRAVRAGVHAAAQREVPLKCGGAPEHLLHARPELHLGGAQADCGRGRILGGCWADIGRVSRKAAPAPAAMAAAERGHWSARTEATY